VILPWIYETNNTPRTWAVQIILVAQQQVIAPHLLTIQLFISIKVADNTERGITDRTRMSYNPTRKLTVFALDPSVKSGGKILRSQIEVPNEYLEAGPRGYRAFIIDYDSSSDTFRRPKPINAFSRSVDGTSNDPFCKWSDAKLLSSPDFHAFMTYGIVMKTLSRFEYALGRRLSWSFGSQQIQVAPHAFSDANAFYSDRAQGLFFGYFPSNDGKRTVFTCLSHEIVAHETTHALLDGLRERYTDPSSPQQAGFHEGFADIVALLSILSAQSIVEKVVDLGLPRAAGGAIRRASVSVESLRNSGLFGLAQQMGSELAGIHGQALRRSIALPPGTNYLTSGDCDEPHTCGEIIVAAVLNAYLDIWVSRLKALGDELQLDRARAAEEGAELADSLLNVCIRAIDYCPPTDIEFSDFASALVTVDAELNPSDAKYSLRPHLLRSFLSYGIQPRSKGQATRQRGSWDPPPETDSKYVYNRTHFENMKSDPDELFRFLWENQALFKLHDQAHTRVLSVRPCTRIGRDGFILRETVAEYHQSLKIFASELRGLGVKKPELMPADTPVTLYGGNAVIFDEYGHVKYNIGKSIMDTTRQSRRLAYLWEQGAFTRGAGKERSFSRLHRRRSTDWYRSFPGSKIAEYEE
jgi:hypothetical protein